MARVLGRHVRTIEREIEEGRVERLNTDLTKSRAYTAGRAQDIHELNATAKGPARKLGSHYKAVEFIRKQSIEIFQPLESFFPDLGKTSENGCAAVGLFAFATCEFTVFARCLPIAASEVPVEVRQVPVAARECNFGDGVAGLRHQKRCGWLPSSG